MDLSVMFFGAAEGPDAADHPGAYDDLLAVARTADDLGFTAIWTPERHFQAVGQIFPNPAVLGAALAASTRRIAIRAGSVVLPLHHPLRVVEDWSVIDNLSRGRVGVSMATGWHSADFVLAPDRFADRRERTHRDIALLRRLWAGEEIELTDGSGATTAVRPQPRPYSAWLPMWLTTSGSAETWETAGRLRLGILAAVAGLDRATLADRIRRYREAYAAAPEVPGSPPHGTVTLMMHAYVGSDDEEAVARVREPMLAYLAAHVVQMAAHRDGAGRTARLSDRQITSLAEYALPQHLAWGTLIGSPQRCRDILIELAGLGCDEVACLVDFGVDHPSVLAGLRRLADLGKEVPA